ncbi:hypothetical protein DUI87_32853 [Hirundo rustica rustica]|uniref:G-protein coupled receptors family 1 profile domain-containing protein n=1 Tax=Hirundo rustica rustica TaxID=333673 RepID=A0A3M0J882_HIRRU|nr:hypothetical protein DUI87_32853 [Hirundo rustica rustica]
MSNSSSSISHFLLLALADTWQLQLLHFCLFLGISLAALLGNGLIISAVACGHHLHTPMFFFLLSLALTDLGSILTTVPKAMHNSLWNTRHISYTGCAAQFFSYMFFMSAEYFLLTIMCYDRYVSICKPLHYGTLLGSRACAHMQQLPGPDKQPQLPQPLLTGLVFQTPHQPCCSSRDTLQLFHVIPKLGDPELDTALEVLLNQCRAQGKNHCPGPDGHTIHDLGQVSLAVLATWAHCWFMSSLLSIRPPRSLSVWLLSSHSVPSLSGFFPGEKESQGSQGSVRVQVGLDDVQGLFQPG